MGKGSKGAKKKPQRQHPKVMHPSEYLPGFEQGRWTSTRTSYVSPDGRRFRKLLGGEYSNGCRISDHMICPTMLRNSEYRLHWMDHECVGCRHTAFPDHVRRVGGPPECPILIAATMNAPGTQKWPAELVIEDGFVTCLAMEAGEWGGEIIAPTVVQFSPGCLTDEAEGYGEQDTSYVNW